VGARSLWLHFVIGELRLRELESCGREAHFLNCLLECHLRCRCPLSQSADLRRSSRDCRSRVEGTTISSRAIPTIVSMTREAAMVYSVTAKVAIVTGGSRQPSGTTAGRLRRALSTWPREQGEPRCRRAGTALRVWAEEGWWLR